MIVNAFKCNTCSVLVYSRAPRDCRPCPGGHIHVDGGFSSYGPKVSFSGGIPPQHVPLRVDVDKTDLYEDWNLGIDQLGVVKL